MGGLNFNVSPAHVDRMVSAVFLYQMGDQVSLARSETVPEGTIVTFQIRYGLITLRPAILEWLDYGRISGFGQWRSAQWGSFEAVLLENMGDSPSAA